MESKVWMTVGAVLIILLGLLYGALCVLGPLALLKLCCAYLAA